jgi:hypothetical protein
MFAVMYNKATLLQSLVGGYSKAAPIRLAVVGQFEFPTD